MSLPPFALVAVLLALAAAPSWLLAPAAPAPAEAPVCNPTCVYLPLIGGSEPPPPQPSPQPQPSLQPTRDPAQCSPAYPTVCIPPPPPDLDCGDIPHRRFTVLAPDPHRFDADGNGVGCESG
jgi:hypothetical protein